MARSTKLTRNHVFDVLTGVESRLENGTLDRDNLAEPYGTFRVNVHVPNLDSRFFTNAGSRPDKVQWFIPFTLPPTQDQWSTTGDMTPSTPSYVLDEVMFSFDQSGEAAAVASIEHGAGANEGHLNYSATDAYDITVSLLEKTPRAWGGAAPWTQEREIFSMTLAPEAFTARGFRFNPFVKDGVSKQLHPYRTYMLCVAAPQLRMPTVTPTRFCALPNVLMSLKCRVPLQVRDTGANVQNMPGHQGGGSARAVTVNTPAAGALVIADGAQGVHTNLAAFDDVLTGAATVAGVGGEVTSAKIGAGYNYNGYLADPPDLQTDACYDVVLVPMWQNFGSLGAFFAGRAQEAPYVGLAPYAGLTGSERYLSIPYPFVIHHMFALVNYMMPRGMGGSTEANPPVHPASGNFVTTIGVGIGTGLRGDHFAIQRIGTATWTPVTKLTQTIDRVKFSQNGLLSEDAQEPWDWEIIPIPIDSRGVAGTGYVAQGTPWYVGRSSGNTFTRSNVGDGAGGSIQPATRGEETFLVFRWMMRDTPTGLGVNPPDLAAAGNNTFANATSISGNAITQADTTAGATAEVGEPAHGGFAATRSIWWRWIAPQSQSVTIDTEGSAVDTTLGVYTGTAVGALTLVAQDDDSGTGTNSTVTFNAVQGTEYKIAVDSKAAGAVVLNIAQIGGGAVSTFEVYAGVGGHWICLICKKPLVNPTRDHRI